MKSHQLYEKGKHQFKLRYRDLLLNLHMDSIRNPATKSSWPTISENNTKQQNQIYEWGDK